MASSFVRTVGARGESSKLVKSWKGASDGVRGGGRGEGGKPLTEEGLVKEEYQKFSNVIKNLLNI